MTTPTLATSSAPASPRPSPRRATAHLDTSMCTCGQDLDVYRSRRCPRCGITLHHAHPLAPAA